MVDVLLPCAPGRIIPEPVMSSILLQDVPITLHICQHIGDGAWRARQYLKDLCAESKNDLTFTMDNDIILPRGALHRLMAFLEDHRDFAAIGISRYYEPPLDYVEPWHISAAPVLFRTEVYKQIDYRLDGCECKAMTDDVRALGYRIGFIGHLQYKHISETRAARVYHAE